MGIDNTGPVERRHVLKSIGAAAGASALAGCGNDGNGDGNGDGSSGENRADPDSDELGERRPEIQFAYYNLASYEEAMPPVQDSIEELGFDVSVHPMEIASLLDDQFNDGRSYDLAMQGMSNQAQRLDPDYFLRRYTADMAGGNGRPNYPNFADCEYSKHAKASQVTHGDERRHHAYKAQEIFSDNYAALGLFEVLSYHFARADRWNWEGTKGKQGFSTNNPHFQASAEPLEGQDAMNIATNPTVVSVGDLNFFTHPDGTVINVWNRVPNSPWVNFDENWNMYGELLEDWTVEDGAQRVTLTMREGGEFHNGDPITAEDTAFTLRYMEEYNDAFPHAQTQNYDSIEVVDDRTVACEFPDPNPRFVITHLTTNCILSENWIEDHGAREDPEALEATPDSFVGSGPLQVADHEPGVQVSLEPHDGHPYYDTPQYDVRWIGFSDDTSIINSFIEGDIDAAWRMSLSAQRTVEEELGEDKVERGPTRGITARYINCQFPMTTREFRRAIGAAVNRQRANLLATDGQADLYFTPGYFNSKHPWRAPEDMLNTLTDDPTGDVEAARQILEDAGWQQDSNGDWRYPPDFDPAEDLAPWPQGEQPKPEYGFDCLTQEGDWPEDWDPEDADFEDPYTGQSYE